MAEPVSAPRSMAMEQMASSRSEVKLVPDHCPGLERRIALCIARAGLHWNSFVNVISAVKYYEGLNNGRCRIF
jgi:hypothetical protein